MHFVTVAAERSMTFVAVALRRSKAQLAKSFAFSPKVSSVIVASAMTRSDIRLPYAFSNSRPGGTRHCSWSRSYTSKALSEA